MLANPGFPAPGMLTEKIDLRSFKSMSLEFVQKVFFDIYVASQLFEQHFSDEGNAPPVDFHWPLVRYGRTRLRGDDFLVEYHPHDGVQLDHALDFVTKLDAPRREQAILDICSGIFYALDFLYGRFPPGELCLRSHLRLSMSTIYLTPDKKILLGLYSLPCNKTESILTDSKNSAFQLDRIMLVVVLRRLMSILNLSSLPRESAVKTLVEMIRDRSAYTFEQIAIVTGLPKDSIAGYSHQRHIIASPRTNLNLAELRPSPNMSAATKAYVPPQERLAHDNSDYFSGTMSSYDYLTTSQLQLMKLTKSSHLSYESHFSLSDSLASNIDKQTTSIHGSIHEESITFFETVDRGLIPADVLLDMRNYYSGSMKRSFISSEKVCPTQLYVAGIYRFIQDNSLVSIMRDKRVLTLFTHDDLYMKLCDKHNKGSSAILSFLIEETNFTCLLQAAFSGIFIERKVPINNATKTALKHHLPQALGCIFGIPRVVEVFLASQQLLGTFFNGLTKSVDVSFQSRNPAKLKEEDEQTSAFCRANLQLVLNILYRSHEAELFTVFQSKQLNWTFLLVKMAMSPAFSKEICPIMKSTHLYKGLVNDLLKELSQITPTSTFIYSQKLCICEHLRVFSQINTTLFYAFSEPIINLYKLIANLLVHRNVNLQISSELINVVITFITRMLYLDVYEMTQKKNKESAKTKLVFPTMTLIATVIKAVASALGKTDSFAREDTFRVYCCLLFIARLYCALGYMFKYITESRIPDYNENTIANPYSWTFYDTPGSAHIVGTSYLGLGDITEWTVYLKSKDYRELLQDIFVLARTFLTPEFTSFLQKVSSTDAFTGINSIQCLLARIRHSIIEIEALVLPGQSTMPILKNIGYIDRLMFYIDRHRNGTDYHLFAERPIELILIVSTLHTIVNFATGVTLTDFYVSRCMLMHYNNIKNANESGSSAESLSASYTAQCDPEEWGIDPEDIKDSSLSQETMDIKRRSPTTLLEYCRFIIDKSGRIEPFCTALGVDFSVLQEAITAFDLIHVFDDFSSSGSIKL